MKRPSGQSFQEEIGHCIKRMKLFKVDDVETQISTESHLLGVAYAKQRTMCCKKNADLRVTLLLGLTIEETEKQLSRYSWQRTCFSGVVEFALLMHFALFQRF